MFCDIISLFFSVLGIIFLLLTAVFKVILWRQENITLLLTIKDSDTEIYTKIFNIKDILDFCSITEKSTVVVLNYGASEKFCNELSNYFGEVINLKIITPEEITELQR